MAIIKSADQISIVDITDAYSVILSNESHTFVGGTNAAVAGTATTNVYAFRGGEQMPVTIGTIAGKTGITATASGSGTTSALVTFNVTTALTSGGTIDIPVTITGTDVTIVKKFTYGIAFTGAKGDKGDEGVGIVSTEITYQAHSSGTAVPTGTWLDSIPSLSAGQYLWTKTEITYTEGDPSVSYSVGMKGATGATGKGVSSTAVSYIASSSGTDIPTGTWSSTIPAVEESEYLWTKTTITYTDNTTSTSYSVGKMGVSAISISITTDNGNIFKNSEGSTTLTAHVFVGGVEITNANDIAEYGTLKWYKDGSTTAAGTGKTLLVEAEDIENKAVYTVQLEG